MKDLELKYKLAQEGILNLSRSQLKKLKKSFTKEQKDRIILIQTDDSLSANQG